MLCTLSIDHTDRSYRSERETGPRPRRSHKSGFIDIKTPIPVAQKKASDWSHVCNLPIICTLVCLVSRGEQEDPDLRRRGMWSLAGLCAQVLDLDLAKPDALRKGTWEKRPLDLDQLFYAAADAYAGLRLWQVCVSSACGVGYPDVLFRATFFWGGRRTRLFRLP